MSHNQPGESFDQEWTAASVALREGQHSVAMKHLGRAHQLGQCTTRQHALSHFGFMRVALERRAGREIAQQLMLTLGALLFTWTWTEPKQAPQP